jgi:hypothetical protein
MKRSLIAFCCLILSATAVQASFETIRNYNPRGIAMGNAILADADPINGFLYNPALVAYAKEMQVQVNSGFPYTMLDSAQFFHINPTVIVPFTYHFKYDKVFKNFVMGFTFNRFQVKSENATYIAGDELNYREHLFGITAAKKFENLFSYGTVLSFGLTANILYHGMSGNLSTEQNDYLVTLKKTTFGLDAGATYYLNKNMVIAGAIENLVPPNASFSKKSEFQSMTSKLGLAWKFPANPKIFILNNATAAGAMWFRNWESKEDSRTAPREYHLGYEFWQFEKYLGVRLGYQWSDFGKSKIQGMSVASVGLASDIPIQGAHDIQVDIAWEIPLIFNSDNNFTGTAGSYTFGLTYRWAWPLSIFEFDSQKREELRQIEEMKKQYQQQQKTERQDTQAQEQATRDTGSVETANASDPDTMATKGIRDRNKALLDLYNGYTKQRDDLQTQIKKAKDDTARKTADLDKKIEGEKKKLEKAKAEEKPAIEQTVKDLTAQRDSLVKDNDTLVADLEKKLLQLKKDTSAKVKTIEADWQKVWKKVQSKVTANYKDEPPTFDYDAFKKEIEVK